MPRLHQSIAGAIFSLVAFAAWPSIAPAQEFMAPAYSRTRMGADDWHARGGGHWHGRGRGGYGYGYNFYQPFYSPVIAGNWYERPYPYHFDYYRHRWGGYQESEGAPNECCGTTDVGPSTAPQ
jgi:hypothetical protein